MDFCGRNLSPVVEPRRLKSSLCGSRISESWSPILKRHEVTPETLKLRPQAENEVDVFCWLIASFLFGKRIQQEIATSAYRAIVEIHKIDSAQKMGACSHRQLVSMLREGRYARYDESTAMRLSALCRKLIENYDGLASEILKRSVSTEDLTNRLQEFDGIGPKTAEIFTRGLG